MAKVLLLGGTGAIGVYLAPELIRRGHSVDITSRSGGRSGLNIRYIKGDAKDEKFLEEILKNNYDVVVDFMVYKTEEFKNRNSLILKCTKQYIFLSTYRVFADDDKVITEKSPRLLDVSTDKEYLATDEYALAKARQEDILRACGAKNWTIVRPSITYSKKRFQLGVLESDMVVRRTLLGKPVLLPIEMAEKLTTMTWAGDVARMISGLILNSRAMGEDFNVVTSESRSWREIVEYYADIIGTKIKYVPLKDFLAIYYDKYQVIYDRMFDRRMDNSKILSVTGIDNDSLRELRPGLQFELLKFIDRPEFNHINEALDYNMDSLVEGVVHKTLRKLKPRTRLLQLKEKARVRTRLRELKRSLRIRTRLRQLAYVLKNKKKDGLIVTLTGNFNYGGIVQRYALKQALRQLGYDFDTVKSQLDERSAHGGVYRNTEIFIDKYIGGEYFDETKLQGYKRYVVGSDQVFRNWYGESWDEFKNFFLGFVKDRDALRISYAASFGVDDLEGAGINEEIKYKVAKQLNKFTAISVRENSGVYLVKDIIDDWEPEVVLDPTLLLSRDDYSALISASNLINNKDSPRLFCYVLDMNQQKRSLIEGTAQRYGHSYQIINPSPEREYEAVEEWLKGFRDAEFVITDSFHGMVFAIINNVDFIVCSNTSRGAARFESLLENLSIDKSRILTDNAEYTAEIPKPIDWARVNNRIEELRAASLDWLSEALRMDK